MIGAMTPMMRTVSAAPNRSTRVNASHANGVPAAPRALPHRHSQFGGSLSAVLPTRVSAPSRRGRVTTTRAVQEGKIKPLNDDDTRPFFDSKEANDITGYANFKSRADLADAALVDRHSVPTTPLSQPFQQTLRRSFTLCGMGLHSGEVETVRVCPAFANEGRYFVRVPSGTIPDDASADADGGAFSRQNLTDEETEDLVLEQLRNMLGNGDESSDGSKQRAEHLRRKSQSSSETADSFTANGTKISASLAVVQDNLRLSTRLGPADDSEKSIGTVEHLLSALEALGVDNARIEVEGTGELPILDGSAFPFCYQASRVGLVGAVTAGDSETHERFAYKLNEPITVTEGDAFIMCNTDDVTKLTYGIDFSYKSRAIGKQWESWTPSEDGRYVDVLARARTFATMPDIMAYFRAGYIKGGTEHCALIANGDTFWNPPMLLPHEPARHKLLDLIGDLSLLAEPGHCGVPVGHIVAYKAGHNLHAKFAKKIEEAIKAGKATKVPAEMWAREIGPDANENEVAMLQDVLPMDGQ